MTNQETVILSMTAFPPKTLGLVLFRPPGCSRGEKCFDWGGVCRLILLVNSIALTEETVQSFKAFKLFKAISDGRSYFRINWFV
jgi:hypothetical protein